MIGRQSQQQERRSGQDTFTAALEDGRSWAMLWQAGQGVAAIMIGLAVSATCCVSTWEPDHLDRARIQETRIRLNKVSAQIHGYYAFTSPNTMPNSLHDLVAPPGGEPPYLKNGDILDAWKRPIVFCRAPGAPRPYRLVSAGPDAWFNTDDDVVLVEDGHENPERRWRCNDPPASASALVPAWVHVRTLTWEHMEPWWVR